MGSFLESKGLKLITSECVSEVMLLNAENDARNETDSMSKDFLAKSAKGSTTQQL